MAEDVLDDFLDKEYSYGFKTNVDAEKAPIGLNEDIIKLISKSKNEPAFMLDFRLKAFETWKKMKEPNWSRNKYEKIDFQKMRYYAVPKKKNQEKKASLDEVDPEILATFDRLGIPLLEQKRLANVAVDAIFDSTSVATTHQDI